MFHFILSKSLEMSKLIGLKLLSAKENRFLTLFSTYGKAYNRKPEQP